jgi:exosortase K
MKRLDLKHWIQLIVALMLAVGLKLYYSAASVNELRWVLTPTAWLAQAITGTAFEFEPYAGYMSYDRTFVIAAACSGVNFLIISFLVLTIGRLWRHRQQCVRWSFITLAFAAAYITTIAANTARISIAILLRRFTSEITLLDAEEIHRVEGIIVYFGFLLMLFIASERIDRGREIDHGRRPTLLRRSLLPLVIYYAATLGIPLVNGAYREPDYWEHFLFVLLTPLLLILPLAAVPYLKDNSTRGERPIDF